MEAVIAKHLSVDRWRYVGLTDAVREKSGSNTGWQWNDGTIQKSTSIWQVRSAPAPLLAPSPDSTLLSE